MKSCVALIVLAALSTLSCPSFASPADPFIQQAQSNKLAQDITWQRLMYADAKQHSEVSYSGYFYHEQGAQNLELELASNIQALFQTAEPDQSIRCRFPARSQFLIESLKIPHAALPEVACPELNQWLTEIKPYKATLIYATDFMGNPSSMFGHTLLRLDPKDQQQLNLVSYAVNYAATVEGEQNWSYAWKGLTGQYPGEYSLMLYYRKVKEYGDFESRDLWEYELALSPEETRFLVQHIWEMKHVQFPYYFIQDNCAYRLLGLIDLVRPHANLQQQFKAVSIPLETIKALDDEQLIKDVVYRPALETQLLAQARQHGHKLAKVAHQIAMSEPREHGQILESYSAENQAKILEMAYDDLYLHFLARKIDPQVAQPRLRQILVQRSQLALEKQRLNVAVPKTNPVQAHDARHLSFKAGEVQGQTFVEIGHRQAYHDLIDPQGGLRTGTQLLFLDGALQYRQDRLKLKHLDLLTVNSYNPIHAFKTPLSWGFNFGWQQEALDSAGHFSRESQHGVANLNVQAGYSWANATREHLCYTQLQNHLQAGKALDQGWRVGAGPTIGCQNVWNEQLNSLIQVELPYWEDSHQWQLKLKTQFQYTWTPQYAIRGGWEYQRQNHQDWEQWSLSLIRYF